MGPCQIRHWAVILATLQTCRKLPAVHHANSRVLLEEEVKQHGLLFLCHCYYLLGPFQHHLRQNPTQQSAVLEQESRLSTKAEY